MDPVLAGTHSALRHTDQKKDRGFRRASLDAARVKRSFIGRLRKSGVLQNVELPQNYCKGKLEIVSPAQWATCQTVWLYRSHRIADFADALGSRKAENSLVPARACRTTGNNVFGSVLYGRLSTPLRQKSCEFAFDGTCALLARPLLTREPVC